jgi:hypothetical protein
MLKTTAAHESKGLTSSTIATLNVPTGGKIHSLVLRLSTGAGADATVAAVKSELSNIRVTINGKDLVNCSPTKLFDLYSTLGQNVNDAAGIASSMELNIGRLVYTDPAVRELFGWGTADVQSIQISITAGTLSTIANARCFTSRAAVNENLGMYFRAINYVVSFNSTGDHTMDTLPRDIDSAYVGVLIDAGASGTITDAEVRVGQISLREKSSRTVNGVLLSNDRYSQQTGYYTHMFTDGQLPSRLPMVGVSDLRFVNTFSVAPGAAGYNMTALTVVNVPSNI